MSRIEAPVRIVKGGVSASADRGLDLDALVWPRNEPCPAGATPVAEIIEVLAETGARMREDPSGRLAAAAAAMASSTGLDRRIADNSYAGLWRVFDPEALRCQVEHELGGSDVLDGWRPFVGHDGRTAAVRAHPPRLIHVLAGNAPGVAAMSIARGALTKGVHLLKLPSNDLFTAPAILETMAEVAPDHPVTRSFSAVYWRGGDTAVESVLMRPQYFDKLVAWGGEAAIRSAAGYIGPGFELVAFDPKSSISLIGREAWDTEESMTRVASLLADDATIFNQEACTSSRFAYVEGEPGQIDAFCAELARALAQDRPTASAKAAALPAELREEIEVLSLMGEDFGTWGDFEGHGLVVRSADPVDFHPTGKTVNVVPVHRLTDATAHASVATQTVGVFPPGRKVEIRDALANAGAQRVVTLGGAMGMRPGLTHDGFYPLHRFVRWVTDED
ncbi:acyl-CoA reductase [Pseudonocardia ailaonensis]|uniref:Acyl-CoA reductase n=1 Tax=Pseudonocardia ailaonensis TaxID=367279 RepID=A0ABN2N9F8_9PSEU